jgi:hypothetical protein
MRKNYNDKTFFISRRCVVFESYILTFNYLFSFSVFYRVTRTRRLKTEPCEKIK